jgi:hypothetical protein
VSDEWSKFNYALHSQPRMSPELYDDLNRASKRVLAEAGKFTIEGEQEWPIAVH